MNIIGIQAFYFSHATTLLVNGELRFFVEEEKINRIKAQRDGFPLESMKMALKLEGLTIDDIDEIAYPIEPWSYTWNAVKQGLVEFLNGLVPGRHSGDVRPVSQFADHVLIALKYAPLFLRNLIRYQIRFGGLGAGEAPKISFVPHHKAHAASAFYPSGWDEAAILIIDGMGETESTTIWKGEGLNLKRIHGTAFPNSLGEFYAAFTEFCGFKTYSQEGKLMGLAAYGRPDSEIAEKMAKVIEIGHENYRVSPKYTINGTHSYGKSYSDALVELFGPSRQPDSELTEFYQNVAYAAQDCLEKAAMEMVKKTVRVTGSKKLCMSGGVAMNCKLNGAILQSGLVEDLFVLPASNDAGAALGAAMVRAVANGENPRFKLTHTYYGPGASDEEIEKVLENIKAPYKKLDLQNLDEVADLLLDKKVVGLYTMKNEFGARALGARSILADTRHKEMMGIVNTRVKHREEWRPFAPVILEGHEPQFFENGRPSYFMMKAFTVRPEKKEIIPAVVHVDDTCRPQSISKELNPVYYGILEAYYKKSGVPVLMNTSFNVRGEPIVSSPIDALRCFFSTGMDALVIGSFLLIKQHQSTD